MQTTSPPAVAAHWSLAACRLAAILVVWSAASCCPAGADCVDRSPGNHLCLLECHRDAIQARIQLIQQATNTIDVAYYAVDTDEVPVALLELLRRAEQRGVRVRLLVDGLKARLPSDFERFLCLSGIEIRVFHPPQLQHPLWLNRRFHSKLIVADAQVAIIGSRNLENEHFGFEPRRQFIDCDAWVAGPLAADACDYFESLWSCPHSLPAAVDNSPVRELLHSRPRAHSDWQRRWHQANRTGRYEPLLAEAVCQVIDRYGVQLDAMSPCGRDGGDVISLTLLHDRNLDKTHRCVQQTILSLIDSARCTLLIESPYPAFDPQLRTAIKNARQRGVEVTVLTNSLESTDQLNVYAAYQNQKRGLLAEGVRLYEFCGPATLHAKSMVVDGRSWMIGSYNFDSRSDHLNLELCVVSHDLAGAALMQRSIRQRQAHAKLIDRGGLLLDSGPGADLIDRPALWIKRGYVELIRPHL